MLRKTFNPVLVFIAFMTVGLLMQGCIKDHCTQTYSYFVPVYKTTAEVRANIKSNTPRLMERTGKLYIRGSYIFLNEVDKGIHIIDNRIPTAPKNVAFIDIPGNMDMAVKGNTLYADAYTDLVALDITDPLNAKMTKIVENAFPFRQYYGTFYPDNSKVIVDWLKRDTTVDMDCGNGGFFGIDFNKSEVLMYNDVLSLAGYSSQGSFNTSVKSISPFGAGGSMARFAVAGNHLYSVTLNDLNVFEISTPQQPSFTRKVNIGWNIETIFPFRQKLFIGSTTGMYIYSIANGNNPVKESQFLHVQSCDPVIADENHAYVTLRTGTTCNGVNNRLEVLDISNINNPSLVKTYEMTNPHGLSKDGDILFVCDGASGLKVYNAADVNDLKLITTFEGLETYDVIAMNKIALVVASDGLYQFLYADPSNIQFLSKIKVTQP